MQFKRRLRYLYYRIIRLQSSPKEIAWGIAIGVFIGFTPTIPFHTALAVLLATLFKENKIAAAAGVWVFNPFTAVPIYALNYQVGSLFYHHNLSFDPEIIRSLPSLLSLGLDCFFILLIGSLMTGLLSGFIAFFITKSVYLYTLKRRTNTKVVPS